MSKVLHDPFCQYYSLGHQYISTINSLWPDDAIRRHGTRSTLAQVMACCLTAPSHYLNHVDLILVRSHGIHLRALSLVDVKIQINKTRLKIAVLKWHLGTPGTNELTPVLQQGHCSTGDDNAFYATHTVTAWRQTPRKLMPSESWILLKHT